MTDKSQKGNILLYTILILSFLIVTMLVVGNIVTQNIKQSGLLKNIQESFYQAESGVEKVLYSVRKLDAEITDGDCQIDDYSCSHKLSYPEEIELNLVKDDSIQIDLYNPDSSGGGVKSLTFEWQTSGAFFQNTWLEVSIVESVPGNFNWIDLPDVKKYLFSPGSGGVGDSVINNLVSNKNYKIKIKSLYNDAENLQITAYNDIDLLPENKQSIAGIINLSTTGKFGSTSYTVKTTFPRYKTPQNIFDYVLFSEEALYK
ncbi:hypothetical protein HN958_00230 [Candidatus Falkowbacteria bacterium]|jgi:hypothetical protein|nr:hypothetical protein [Candidatus Falkowbacteria bacterium]MBT7006915.1 hypothetical protein [Candidatus Falkowbacteria bacterium]